MIGCSDWNIVVFQNTFVRVYYILKSRKDQNRKFIESYKYHEIMFQNDKQNLSETQNKWLNYNGTPPQIFLLKICDIILMGFSG